MKYSYGTLAFAALIVFSFSSARQALAQGYDTPLGSQGLSRTTMHSAASRAAGGITIALKNDMSLMFSNPALLSSLEGLQLSLGGLQQHTYAKQEQRYGGLQTHTAFNLLMEGTTGLISDADTSKLLGGTKVRVIDQTDSVQRPFDTIGPNWNRTRSKGLPVQILLASPFSIGTVRVVVGLGAVEYANLNWYYQNNN